MKIKTSGYIALFVGVILSASIPIAYSYGSSVPAFELATFVALVGTVASFALMLLMKKQGNLKEIARNKMLLLSLVAFGILAYTFVVLIFSYTTHYISAALLAVVYRTWPLMLIFLAPIVLREKIGKYDMLALVIGFAGLLATLIGNTSISIPIYLIPFVILVLFAAFSDSLGNLLQKRYTFDIYSSLFIYNLTSFILLFTFSYFTNQLSLSTMTLNGIYSVLFLGTVQNIALTFFFLYSLRVLKTPLAGNAYLVSPFVTMVLGVIILNQPVQLSYIVVAVAVLAGIAIQRFGKYGSYISKSRAANAPTIFDVTSAFVNTKNDRIYKMMKANGRVLAFYKDTSGSALELNDIDTKGDNFMLFTSKTAGGEITQDELEFVKEILGCGENDLLVFGAGEPDVLEQKLFDVHSRISGFG